MEITVDKLREILSRYYLVTERDVEDALSFTKEILEAEADAIKEKYPYATNTVSRLNAAAYEVFNLIGESDELVEEALMENDV